MTLTLVIASLLSPFFVDFAPEVRSTYISLGKIVEDRPMQVTSIRAGIDTSWLGRIGFRNWDVSSLTDRLADVHRHVLYHTEYGAFWRYDWGVVEDFVLRSELTYSWTIYRGYDNSASNTNNEWWQFTQSLENEWLVPFYCMRRAIRQTDFFYFRLGLRRKFPIVGDFYLLPSIQTEGGNGRNFQRVFGDNVEGDGWGAGGICSLTERLEAGWEVADWATLFAYVEQYDVVGSDARSTNEVSSSKCIHNDWTSFGVGLRCKW